MSGPQPDSLHRFLFERLGVRGELVCLDAAYQAVLSRHSYPGPVQRPLGEALACALLLTATLKFEGKLTLQAQGSGPIRTLVVQGTHEGTVRGLARWQEYDQVDDKPRSRSRDTPCALRPRGTRWWRR